MQTSPRHSQVTTDVPLAIRTPVGGNADGSTGTIQIDGPSTAELPEEVLLSVGATAVTLSSLDASIVKLEVVSGHGSTNLVNRGAFSAREPEASAVGVDDRLRTGNPQSVHPWMVMHTETGPGRAAVTFGREVYATAKDGTAGHVHLTSTYSLDAEGLSACLQGVGDICHAFDLSIPLRFNLGDRATLHGHQLQVLGSYVLGPGGGAESDGSLIDVGGSPLDLRWPTLLDRRLDSFVFDSTAGIDHSYLLDYAGMDGPPAAILSHVDAGVALSLFTDHPLLHIRGPRSKGHVGSVALGLVPHGFSAGAVSGDSAAMRQTWTDGPIAVDPRVWTDAGEVASANLRIEVAPKR